MYGSFSHLALPILFFTRKTDDPIFMGRPFSFFYCFFRINPMSKSAFLPKYISLSLKNLDKCLADELPRVYRFVKGIGFSAYLE